MSYYMYVTISEENKILVFTIDPGPGKLKMQSSEAVIGKPAPLAIDPNQQFLYVGYLNSREITSYRINGSTGGLSLIDTVTLPDEVVEPCYLATDRKGKFLFSTYYYTGKVAVHPISENGAVGNPPVEWIDTAKGAHSLQTDPSNKFAFVPHIAAPNGPNMILQFRFNEITGRLTPNSPPRVIPEENVGPRHFCFHPHLDVLYFSNEQGCSVTAYKFDSSTGTLSAFQTVSTLPDDFKGNNTCAQIQISPSGKFLYAPNRGHNSIACFAIDTHTGQLTPIERVPTEAVPRAFSLDPEGNFLFAAGRESGRLTSYRINEDSGKLKLIETYTIGKAPMWVLTTKLSG